MKIYKSLAVLALLFTNSGYAYSLQCNLYQEPVTDSLDLDIAAEVFEYRNAVDSLESVADNDDKFFYHKSLTDSLHSVLSQEEKLRNQAIAQMNYNISSLTRIVRSQSMDVLQYELNQLINNLTIEHITDLYEIKSYRSEFMNSLGTLIINAEEKSILRQIQEKNRKNMVWNAVSSALDAPMILTGASSGGQAAFYALLGVARGAINYKAQMNQAEIEELQAMWNLKKVDLTEIYRLRNSAFDVTYDLFKRFDLKEKDRLVEENINLYVDIVDEPDTQKRIRLLQDNYSVFEKFSDYYYHLGMAYFDNGEFAKADECFDKYLKVYYAAPIFRKNDKVAYINLAKLSIYENMPGETAKKAIDEVVRIIPDNGISMIHCALKYREYGFERESFELLRKSLDNINCSDKNAILMTVLSMRDEILKYEDIWSDIKSSFYSMQGIDLDLYIAFILQEEKENIEKGIEDCIEVKGSASKNYYMFGSKSLDGEFEARIDSRCNVLLDSLYCYNEIWDDDELIIRIHKQKFGNSVVEREDLIDDVSCFAMNPELIYNFFTSVSSNEYFVPRADVNISKIEEYEGMQNVSNSDKNEIASILSDFKYKDGAYRFTSRERSNTMGIGSINEYEFVMNQNADYTDADTKTSSDTKKYVEYVTLRDSSNLYDSDIDDGKFKVVLPYGFKSYCVEHDHVTDAEYGNEVEKSDSDESSCGQKIVFYGTDIADLRYVPLKVEDGIERCLKIVYNGNMNLVLTYVMDLENENNVRLYAVELNGDVVYGKNI